MYFKRALEISETIYQNDPWHSDIASKLDALGYLHYYKGVNVRAFFPSSAHTTPTHHRARMRFS